MGSVLTAIATGGGSQIGNVVGGIAGGTADAAGATNRYQISNPYSQQVLQTEVNNQAQIYQNQQNLAQALQAQMAGQGPNPAQVQYQQNLQNNIANAQGLIASQRGLNPALAARMGLNAGAAANQQGALGSALLQQQQQLGATANLGNLYGQMQQGNLGEQQLYNQGNLGAEKIGADISGTNAQIRGNVAGGLFNAIGAVGGKAATSGKAKGGIIEGKAKVSGNSYSNDTVPIMASPGEGIIDREHMESRELAHKKVDAMFDEKEKHHDPKKTKEFIEHLKKKSKNSKAEYGDVLKARRKAS